MRKSVWIVLLLTCAMNSCSSEKKEIEKNTALVDELPDARIIEDSLYRIQIPNTMKLTNSLDVNASLQFSDVFREQFVTVSEFDKKDHLDRLMRNKSAKKQLSALENFSTLEYNAHMNAKSLLLESKWSTMEIDGSVFKIKAVDVEIYGASKEISYWLAFVEGKNRLYTIKLWTPKNRKHLFEESANLIIRSFRERE